METEKCKELLSSKECPGKQSLPVWGRGTKTVLPVVWLKGKYCLLTTTIISSSAVKAAGIDQKEKITPEVSHINAKQAVMGERRKGKGE